MKPSSITTIPETNHKGGHSKHRPITRGLSNTKPELGILCFLAFPQAVHSGISRICVETSQQEWVFQTKAGLWSNRFLSTIFLTSLSPLWKALMERCSKHAQDLLTTGFPMSFLDFLCARNSGFFPPLSPFKINPLFKFLQIPKAQQKEQRSCVGEL